MTRPSARIAIVSLAAAVLSAAMLAQNADKEKAMMEAWQRAATPGESHKKLEALVGTFDAKVRAWSWFEPSKAPEDTTGTSINTWVLGGRFVEQQYDGTFMGEALSGIGYTGYDNVQKKFVSVWMDSAATGMMFMTAGPDASGKTLTAKTQVWDAATGKAGTVEARTFLIDHDHHNFELWGKGADGKTMKIMEISYTRKK